MTVEGKTFGTAVGCMDGRGQLPVVDYVRKRWRVDYVDNITDAGIVRHIAHTHNNDYLQSIKTKVVDVSVEKHGSKGLVVWGHQKCAGNPVEDDHHKRDIRVAAQRIREMQPGVEVVPLFLYEAEPAWSVEEL